MLGKPIEQLSRMKATNSHRERTGFKGGFTLIELLVVIAVIAILAALFLPALAKSKEIATGSRCLGNQKQLMLAWLMYADDHNGTMIGQQYLIKNKLEELAGGGFWPDALSVALPATEPQRQLSIIKERIKNGPLYPYNPAVEGYHCPGDKRLGRKVGSPGWAFDSYSKANGMNGLQPPNQWESPADYYPVSKISGIPKPSQMYVFVEESDPRGYNLGTWVLNIAQDNWVDGMAIFHNIASSFGMSDGHAELHKWIEAETVKAGRQFANGMQAFYWKRKQPVDRDWIYIKKGYVWAAYPKNLKWE